MVGDAYLEEGRGEAVGEVLADSRSADADGPAESSSEPILVLCIGANANPIGDSKVRTATESDQVIAQRGLPLVEPWDGVKSPSSSRYFNKGAVAAVVTVVTYAVLESPLFCGGVLLDRDGVVIQLGAPVGSNVGNAEDPVTDGVLRSVVGNGVGEGRACIDIDLSDGAGHGLSESKRGASSQYSQDENNSFQWMASIGRVWDCFCFSVDEVVLEIPALFEDILIVPVVWASVTDTELRLACDYSCEL